MNTKKRISLLTAAVIALSVAATGCKSADGDTANTMPSLDSVTSSETVTTTLPETTTAPPETTTTVYESEEMQPETETASATEETTAPETSETTAQTWNESQLSEMRTLYITEKCYARENAIIGSTPIATYYAGDAVNVVAITDTGYYKLENGGFVHSDYVSEIMPATTAETTAPPPETTAPTSTSTPAYTTTSAAFVDPALTTTAISTGGAVIDTPGYTRSSTDKYAYKQLSATEQELYNDIVTSVKTLNQSVKIPSGMSSDDVIKVYSCVYNAEPQLFWMNSSITVGSAYATISFKTTDRNEIASMQSEINAAAANFINKANAYSGTFSKLKVFYDTLVKQSEFSKSESGYNASIYNGLLGKGGLQCAGYAKTIEYLCDLAGIDCMVITGTTADQLSHAWNVVYCDNGWYNFDATWGDPVNNFDSNYVQYEFFLVPDSWIHNITHCNVNKIFRNNGNVVKLFDPPSCTKEAANYFNVYNKVYSTKADAEAALYAEFDAALASGANLAEIRVTSKDIYDVLLSDDYAKTFQRYCKSKSSSVSGLARQTSSQSGVLVVHYDIKYNS